MSAQDWISTDQVKSMFGSDIFHGTSEEFEPGDLIDPKFAGRVHPESEPGHAYFTADYNSAKDFAHSAVSQYGGYPNVYKVAPTGPSLEDAYNGGQFGERDGFKSKHPLRIIGEA